MNGLSFAMLDGKDDGLVAVTVDGRLRCNTRISQENLNIACAAEREYLIAIVQARRAIEAKYAPLITSESADESQFWWDRCAKAEELARQGIPLPDGVTEEDLSRCYYS